MASQLVATSGNKRLRPNQTAALRSRQAYLPQIMAQKKLREERAQDLAFRERQFSQSAQQSKDQLAMQRKAQKMSAGVSAANLGMGIQNLQQSQGPTGGLSRSLSSSGLPGGSSIFGDFNIGQGLTSGLAGFGASQFAGDNKWKKLGFGAGAGALAGLFTGSGSGSSIGSGLGGAIFGGLGSLFG